MAAVKTGPKELSVEEKLQQLWDLQQIDTKVDKIQILKGELPIEVKDLEDEIEGLNTRLGNSEGEVAELEEEIKNRKNAKSLAKELISRYEKQQDNVKNNREYDALSKEIELQRLEIQLSEKKINDACKEANVFCGVILSPADLGNVIALAVQTGGNVKIPFKLYFNE